MIKERLKAETNSCSCGCIKESIKKVLVEFLYLDLKTCERCMGADAVLDEVMQILTPALELAGYRVDYKKVKMETAEMAEQYKFLSSPTIKVNGKELCATVQENSCGCCSEISGTDVDCRVFEHNGETYKVPPKEMLANDVLSGVFESDTRGGSCETEYELPENLKAFYEGKKNTGRSNGGDCCQIEKSYSRLIRR